MDVGCCIVPGGWVPVDFTVDEFISYTFVRRLSSGRY